MIRTALALLRDQVPDGTDGNKLNQADANKKELTCPYSCVHRHYLPTNGKGIVNYAEKYTGFQYCTLYETKLCRVVGGCDMTFQVNGCPKESREEINKRNEIELLQQTIQHTEDRLLELKSQLKEITES